MAERVVTRFHYDNIFNNQSGKRRLVALDVAPPLHDSVNRLINQRVVLREDPHLVRIYISQQIVNIDLTISLPFHSPAAGSSTTSSLTLHSPSPLLRSPAPDAPRSLTAPHPPLSAQLVVSTANLSHLLAQ